MSSKKPKSGVPKSDPVAASAASHEPSGGLMSENASASEVEGPAEAVPNKGKHTRVPPKPKSGKKAASLKVVVEMAEVQVPKGAATAQLRAEVEQITTGRCGSDSTPLPQQEVQEPAFPWDRSRENEPGVRHGRLAADLANDPEITRVLVEVVPGLSVACRLSLLVAREKLGKSTYLAFCAAELTQGLYHGVPGRVLWCGMEEPVGDTLRRFEQMNADLSLINVIDRPEPSKVTETICQEIASFRPALVVVDSLAVIGAYLELQEKSEEGWTSLFDKFRKAAQDYGCGLVILHHARKADGIFRGSTAIAAAADQLVTMFEDDKDPNCRRMSPRGRWPIPEYRITFSPETTSYTRGDLPTGEQDGAGDEVIAGRLIDFLQSHPGSGKTETTAAGGVAAIRSRRVFDALVEAGRFVLRDKKWWVADQEATPNAA
jgi:hypothetical protein